MENIWIDKQYTNKEKKLIKNLSGNTINNFNHSDLFLNLDIPSKIKYRESNRSLFKSRIHKGQRKLFLSELFFLTEYGHLSDTIIYVGAAPGHHIKLLSELFPDHIFYLYDPRNVFDEELEDIDNINIYVQYFTDEDANNWKYEDILFISDIRIGKNKYNEMEKQIKDDMELQMEWVKIINPLKSLLKFRLPWDRNNITYLSGKIIYQAYPSLFSTETRLIVDKEYKLIDYIGKVYDNKMHEHNYIDREWKMFNIEYNYYNNGWDCACEEFIINNYCNTIGYYDLSEIVDKMNMGNVDPYNIKNKNRFLMRKSIVEDNYKMYKKSLNISIKKRNNNKN